MNFVNSPEAQLVMHIQCDQLLVDKCKSGDINDETCVKLRGYFTYGGGNRPATSFNELGAELASLIYNVFPSFEKDKRSFKINLFQVEGRPKKVYKLTIIARPEGSEKLFKKIFLAVQTWIDAQNG